MRCIILMVMTWGWFMTFWVSHDCIYQTEKHSKSQVWWLTMVYHWLCLLDLRCITSPGLFRFGRSTHGALSLPFFRLMEQGSASSDGSEDPVTFSSMTEYSKLPCNQPHSKNKLRRTFDRSFLSYFVAGLNQIFSRGTGLKKKLGLQNVNITRRISVAFYRYGVLILLWLWLASIFRGVCSSLLHLGASVATPARFATTWSRRSFRSPGRERNGVTRWRLAFGACCGKWMWKSKNHRRPGRPMPSHILWYLRVC